MNFVWIIIALLGIFILRKWLVYQEHKKKFAHIPMLAQFTPFSLLTMLPILPINRTNLFKYVKAGMEERNTSVFCGIIFGYPIVFVNDAELVKSLLITHRKTVIKPVEAYKPLTFFGEHILSTEGEEWRKHRETLNPAFGEPNMKLVAKTTLDSAKSLFKKWNAIISQKGELVADLHREMMKMTLAVISSAGFGQNFDICAEEGSQDAKLGEVMTVVSEKSIIKAVLPSLLYKLPIKSLQKVNESFNTFKQMIIDIINTRKFGTEEEKSDILNFLCRSNTSGDITATDLLADSYIMILAASTLGWAFRLLAMHPDVQEKAFQEVNEILKGREPTYDDWKELVYCQWVFKETLRLYPPVAQIPKFATEDMEIGGYFVPKQTFVSISAYALHRNPKYWDNPNSFQPERFDTQKNPNIHTYAFIPFSAGPRSCLGTKFAMVEGIIALAMVVQNFVIKLPEGVSTEKLLDAAPKMTLQPKHTINLILVKRNTA